MEKMEGSNPHPWFRYGKIAIIATNLPKVHKIKVQKNSKRQKQYSV